MKAYIFLGIIFVTIYTSWAAVFQGPPSLHKDYPNQCYVEFANGAYAVGEHNLAGKCMKLFCHKDFSFMVHTCGTVEAPEGYHNEVDYSKPYPDCCINIVKD